MRHGLSLLELMLVLALLAIVAAFAMPAVGLSLDKHNLRNAGETLRTRFAKARVKAMEKGRTYTFRYEPAGRTFIVAPYISDEDYLESSQLTMNGGMPGGMMSSGSVPDATVDAPVEETLPDTVTFVGSEIADDSRGMLISEVTGMASETTLSAPIYFYPDGTTSTARLLIVNERNRYITITLRGLTGLAQVTDIQSFEEIQ